MDEKYDILLNQFEDAYFNLLMYRVAEAEAVQLLEENEKLKCSGFEIPPELDQKCRKLIEDFFETRAQQEELAKIKETQNRIKEQKRLSRRRFIRTLFIAALLSVFVFTAAYATNPRFRTKVLNIMLQITEEATIFEFSNNDSSYSSKSPVSFEFTYIPENFVLTKEDYTGNLYSFCGYVDQNNNIFSLSIDRIGIESRAYVDTEDATVTEMEIHGCNGWLIQKQRASLQKESINWLWIDTNAGLSFLFETVGIPYNEAEKIFNSLKLVY